MADKKTGPVKPPVLDMTARDSDKKKPDTPARDRQAEPDASPSADTGPQAKSAPPKKTGPTDEKRAEPETASGSDKSKPDTGSAGPDAKPAEPAKTGAAQPGAPTRASGTGDGKSTSPPEPETSAARKLAAAGIAGILAGAAGGAAIAYSLAAAGLWPMDPGLEAGNLEQRLAGIEARTADLAGARAQADERIGALETDLAARIEAVESGLSDIPQPVTSEAFESLSSEVNELAARIQAVGAGASEENAEELGAILSGLRADLDALAAEVETGPDLTALNERIAALEPRVEEIESSFAHQPDIEAALAERDRFAQLPGLSAQLETALETGQPFVETLARLEQLIPDLELDNAARAVAVDGAPATRAIISAFRSELAGIIAARPRSDAPGWFENILDQARAAVALRPAGNIEGDDPDARIARLETALEAGEFGRAGDEFAGLPVPMRDAAGRTGALIEERLLAESVLAQVRALAGEIGARAAEAGQ